MKDLLRYLKTRTFLKNFAMAAVAFVALMWGSLAFLSFYTDRGEAVSVRDFVGYKIEDLDEIFAETTLEYVIIDSVYKDKAKRGTVVEQFPKAESQVKEGRTIYLTINARSKKMVSMPNLVDLDKSVAIAKLYSYKLRVKELKYIPDAACVDCVLKQEYKGEEIEPGQTIPEGSQIVLVLGEGMSGEMTWLPPLVGLTITEAKLRLAEKSLNLGAVNCLDCIEEEDSLKALIFEQDPPFYKEAKINLGAYIDVRTTMDSTLVNVPAIQDTLPDVDTLMMKQ